MPSSFTPLLSRPQGEVAECERHRTWFGSKETEMGFSFHVWFTGQCTKYYIRFFSLIVTKVGMVVTESEIV